MRPHEQARLFLQKAEEDEALLVEVLGSSRVSNAIIGFHCQQAAEKLLKAMLSEIGVPFPKTHDLRMLMDLLSDAGSSLPPDLDGLDHLTPFGTLFRYEGTSSEPPLDRGDARDMLRRLRAWVERKTGNQK